MGYGRKQMDDLKATIEASGAELVLIGTPIDLRKLIDFDVPALRVTYKLQEVGEPTLADVLRSRATGLDRRRSTAEPTAVVVTTSPSSRSAGNALMRPGERGTAAEQRANLREACAALRPLLGEERARRHARKRPAGRQRAAAPGARRRRGAAAAALPRGRADAGRDRRADRERARARSPDGRSPACSRTCSSPRTTPPSRSRRSRSGRSTARTKARDARARARLEGRPRRGPRVAARRPLAAAARGRRARTRSARCSRSGSIVVACGGGGIPATRRGEHLAGHRRRDRQGPRLRPPRPRASAPTGS